jgi:hypothetical protein
MKDWIKKALTKHTRNREIPPNPKLVYTVKFAITMTISLTILETAHLITLKQWNSEIFAVITGLTGTVSGILIAQKT